jgi:hypothetical protein
MDVMQPNLELQIDELVIDGLPHLNRAQLGAIVQQELARLFAERGIPPALYQAHAVPSIEGGAITLQPGASTPAVGGQIAQALYGGFAQRR